MHATPGECQLKRKRTHQTSAKAFEESIGGKPGEKYVATAVMRLAGKVERRKLNWCES